MLDPRHLLKPRFAAADEPAAPLTGTRANQVQRLQIGMGGLALMVVLVLIADLVMRSAARTEATVSPEIEVPVASTSEGGAPSDPLADAGVVPNVPAGGEASEPAKKPELNDVPPPAAE